MYEHLPVHERINAILARLADIKAADRKLAEVRRALSRDFNRVYMRITMRHRRAPDPRNLRIKDNEAWLATVKAARDADDEYVQARTRANERHASVNKRRNLLRAERLRLEHQLAKLRKEGW